MASLRVLLRSGSVAEEYERKGDIAWEHIRLSEDFSMRGRHWSIVGIPFEAGQPVVLS